MQNNAIKARAIDTFEINFIFECKNHEHCTFNDD